MKSEHSAKAAFYVSFYIISDPLLCWEVKEVDDKVIRDVFAVILKEIGLYL